MINIFSAKPRQMSVWSTGPIGLDIGVFEKNKQETSSTTKLFHRPHGKVHICTP